MGIGSITPSAAGSVTAPTTGFTAFTIPSALSVKVSPHAMLSVVDLPEIRGQMMSDGISALRHVVTNVLRTGPLAPSAALAAAGTSVRATATLTCGANPSLDDGDDFLLRDRALYLLPAAGYGQIVFQSALSAVPATHEVLIGADDEETLNNLEMLINGTGTQGTQYIDYSVFNGGTPWFRDNTDITCSSTSATVATFRAATYGLVGNGYTITKGTDGATAFSVAAWSGGAAGTGTEPASGTYAYVYQFYRTEDGALSGASPDTEITVDGNGNVSLTNLAASLDADVDYTRWNRTAVGGNVYYRGYDILVAAALDTDDRPDDDITAENAVAYDATAYRLYEGGYPPKPRYLARYKGRVFGGGALLAADTPTFVANVTAGSRTVALVSGNPTKDWEGRAMHLALHGEPHRIIYVDPSSTGTLYLDREAELTDTTTDYVVKDDRDPYELFYSEPLLPNNWPVVNSVKGVSGVRGTGITGLIEAWESLVIFTEEGVWRLTGDGPGSFQIHQAVKGSGCVSGHTVRMVDGVLYWLGHSAIYAWSGSGEPVAITSPPTEGGAVRGIEDTMARLNLAHVARAHAHYDPDARILRFFVPLDSDVTNRWAIVLDIQTGTFSLDTCEDWTCAATVRKPNGAACTLAGDVCGIVWQSDIGNCDGAFGHEPRTTVTSWTSLSVLELGTTPAFTSDVEGVPLWYVDTSGDIGRVRVVSTGSTAVTFARHYETAGVGWVYVFFGAIPLWLRTGRFDIGIPNVKKTVAAMRLFFDVDTDGEGFVAWAKDQGTPTVKAATPGIDLTVSDGEQRIKVQKDGRSHQLELLILEPGCDPHLLGYTLEYRGVGGE